MKIDKLFLIGFAIYLTLVGNLQAASFNCQKAGNFIEHTICNDKKLSKLDDDLALSYKNVMKSTKNKELLKQQQFAWIEERNICKTVKCLQNSYSKRISQLSSSSNSIVGNYHLHNASITINQDLSFSYDNFVVYGDIDEGKVAICLIEGKFTEVNKLFIWQDEEDYPDEYEKCRLEVTQIDSNSINLSTKESNCYHHSYCGMKAFMEDGIFRK
ncbi:lysozyme inhibitor LprI family protein [Aliarcobacter lanthieri]|uniref:lysozyme inhibitor LprI family protein n=1 Tax=Aliarcobacter lanthieri TaxID=1355374 RepID=UPI003AA8FEAD